MHSINLDVSGLEYICDDSGNRNASKWYFDPAGRQYVRLTQDERFYTARIPAGEFPTLAEFISGKGHMPKSAATIRLCRHREALDVHNHR